MTREEKIISEAKKYFKDDINCYDAFLYGVEFAEDNQWISVEDDLPCNHLDLLVDGTTTKFVLVIENGFPKVTRMQRMNFDGGWSWLMDLKPTHWMIIPDLK